MRGRLCQCGCGRVVKSRRAAAKWASQACVPRSVRAANCRKGRRTYAYRRRALAFKADLDRVVGRSLTREDLLAVLQAVYKRAYNTGFQAGKSAARRGDVAIALAAAKEREAA